MVSTRTVLLVEDEQTLRQSILRGLSKLNGIRIVGAANTQEAKALLAKEPPDLLISDLDLPDGTGLEVVAEAERLGLRMPVVFISAFLARFQSRIPQRSNLAVYEKPVSLERLRAIVQERVGSAADAAMAAPFGVTDYVQLASLGRYSVFIEVKAGASHGRISIHRGELWSAEDERGQGVAAFRRLAFCDAVQVVCRTLDKGDLPERNIDGSAESVLLEAARVFDETPPAPELAPAKPKTPWEEEESTSRRNLPDALRGDEGARFEAAFDRGVDALLVKDFDGAYAAFLEASALRPDDRHVVANLARLRAMGKS
jgi:DNA-binding response OmpR family regulator